MIAPAASPADLAAPAECLACIVGGEPCLLPLAAVSHIVRTAQVVPVPLAPPAVRGLMNDHGSVRTVLSLTALLDKPDQGGAQVVLLKQPANVGLLVDRVDGLVSGAAASLDLGEVLARHMAHAWAHWRASAQADARPAAHTAAIADDAIDLLVFDLDGAEYALPLTHVFEVAHAPGPVAAADDGLGTITLDSRALPLVDLRAFWLAAGPCPQAPTLILAHDGRGMPLAIAVDRAVEVRSLPRDALGSLPPLLGDEAQFGELAGVWQDDGAKRLISIIAPDRLFSPALQARLDAFGITPLPESTAAMQAQSESDMLVVVLDGVEMALPLATIEALIRVPDDMQAPPSLPVGVVGIINWRGSAVAVIDLRQRLGLASGERTLRRRIVLVRSGGTLQGVLVDEARDIVALGAGERMAAPVLSESQAALVPELIHAEGGQRILQCIDLAALSGTALAAASANQSG